MAQRVIGETCNYHWNMYGKKDNNDFVLLCKYKKGDSYTLLCNDCKKLFDKQK